VYAVVISRPGGPEVLDVREVPAPSPQDREVLVRVRAAGLNRADLLQRLGRYPAPAGSPANIPGLEFAGEIAGVGASVTRWREGDSVFGIVGGGAHAQYLTTHEDAVASVARGLTWLQAAAVPEVFITAHDAMIIQAGLQPGELVLIHAVGSGVALAAIQLIRTRGAVPYGTSRTASKVERAAAHGLAGGMLVRDRLDVIVEESRRWSNGRGMNVILDLVGGGYTGESVRAAAPQGRLMLVGTMGGPTASIPLGVVLHQRLTLRGTSLRGRTLAEKIVATAAFVRDVVPLLEDGRVRPVIDSIYSLADVARAHERVERNETFGKVVLAVD